MDISFCSLLSLSQKKISDAIICLIVPYSLQMLRKFHYILSCLQRHRHNRQAIQQVHSQLIFFHNTLGSEYILTLWNSLLRHYALGAFPRDAVSLFSHLQHLCQPVSFDSFTYSFLIKASGNLSQTWLGKQFHCFSNKTGFVPNVYVQTALVDMYMNCGCMGDARKVFNRMPQRNSVTWNALITGFIRWADVESARAMFDMMPEKNIVSWTCLIDGYTRTGQFHEALSFFRRMVVDEGIKPSEVTLLAVFPAVWNLRYVEFCQMVHAYGEKTGLNVLDIRVMNCLLDAYAKCGRIDCAQRVFEDISDERSSLVAWTSLISGFAIHGMAKEASECFTRMETTGTKPNRITFLSILNACSHGGLIDEGLQFFKKMIDEFQIIPDIKHYGCLIDMLGRAGRLEEAEEMAKQIPNDIENVVIWRTLLGACGFHENIEIAERVTEKIMEMERKYGGDYILMSNIFAGVGRFSDSEKVRKHMDKQNAAKLPGLSFV